MICEPPRELPREAGTQPKGLRTNRSFRRTAFLLPRVGHWRCGLRLGTDLHVRRFQAAVIFFPIGSADFFARGDVNHGRIHALLSDLGLVRHFDGPFPDGECFGGDIDRSDLSTIR